MEINTACPRRLAQQLELCVSTLVLKFWFELILVELIVSKRHACGGVGMLGMGGCRLAAEHRSKRRAAFVLSHGPYSRWVHLWAFGFA